MSDQLCTTAQVKARLGITDAADDALISELIDQVSAWIEGYTGRKLVPENAATYVFDTAKGYVLRVPRGIRSITSMGVATTHQPDSGGTYVTMTAANLLLRPKAEANSEGWPFFEVRITRGAPAGTGEPRSFGSYENGATITGNFGWAVIPPEIASVAIDAVVAAKQALGDGASSVIGADDIAIAPWRNYFMRGSPQRATLDQYRSWSLA